MLAYTYSKLLCLKNRLQNDICIEILTLSLANRILSDFCLPSISSALFRFFQNGNVFLLHSRGKTSFVCFFSDVRVIKLIRDINH